MTEAAATLLAVLALALVPAMRTEAASDGAAPGGAAHDDDTPDDPGAQASPQRDLWLLATRAVIGTTVENPAGHELGTIEEMVVDPGRRALAYAVLAHGGVLGVGDALHAIPWSAFELRSDLLEPGQRTLLLDVEVAILEETDGFDRHAWPRVPGERWRSGTDRTREAPANPDSAERARRLIRIGDLFGATVRDSAGTRVGDVQDVLIDTETGTVAYVVIVHGGVLELGQETAAVPWRAVSVLHAEDAPTEVFGLLEKHTGSLDRFAVDPAGGYDELESRERAKQLHESFGVTPYWQPRPADTEG
ncbi:MAG: PRC-barrel domain-containing protein [Candidatus Eiseniibacteriota bacterium]